MMFFDKIFKRRSSQSSLNKKLPAKKCKLVNYVAVDFEALCSNMENSDSYLLNLVPVNYYAIKSEYIEASFYSDETYDENYVVFRLIKNDRPIKLSGIYAVDKAILRKAYERLGAVSF